MLWITPSPRTAISLVAHSLCFVTSPKFDFLTNILEWHRILVWIPWEAALLFILNMLFYVGFFFEWPANNTHGPTELHYRFFLLSVAITLFLAVSHITLRLTLMSLPVLLHISRPVLLPLTLTLYKHPYWWWLWLKSLSGIYCFTLQSIPPSKQLIV